MAEPLLSLRGVSAGYAESVVLNDINLDISEGSGLAVLGRNGVGKSTLIETVMGFTRLVSGSIHWRGRDITRLKPHQRAAQGIGWIPQERCVFPTLTVEENLNVVARPGSLTAARVYEIFPRLAERRQNRGSQLSGGEQQMLAIGRTLMTNPSLLLLDEPLEGLAPIVIEELGQSIAHMSGDEGMTLVLVEQHAELALEMTREAVIIERGRIVHRAPAAELRADHDTLDRYIGLNLGE
ncbi:MAG: ABC transporter ATP-binding protein [Betaproteobacteria bacterium RIFCSPLOWO2_12_FULL_63_13]|jgi:branched-chain amino acid transport system ATP-binding protein|nr:MAG: ABC transporter ATP-binding protein [Betaproteobacteria bacterium RIFCSPLOWO2_02_FULL_63_19]OGA52388.1 MAG: ABC transporter ATP-binding protein [Betaproteobacteria bacterium RIFCSPLOWO2_12_FULL_63_13]